MHRPLQLPGLLGSWECAEGSAESRGTGPPPSFFCAERRQLGNAVGTLLAQKYTDVWEGAVDSSLRRKIVTFCLEALYPSGTSPLAEAPGLTE